MKLSWLMWVEKMFPEDVPAPQGAGALLLQLLKGDPQGTKKSSRGECMVDGSNPVSQFRMIQI